MRWPMVFTMRQPPNSVPEADGEEAARDDPDRQVILRGDARRDQQQPDDAHGLLRVVAAVTEAIGGGRHQLQRAGTTGPRAWASGGRQIHDTMSMSSEPSSMPSSGEITMNAAVLMMPGASSGAVPALAMRGADHAADERVRGARRNAVVPGDEVPRDRADQRAEDQPVVDERRDRRCPCRPWRRRCRSKTAIATKLKNAAHSTACQGLSTPVETTVAMEFAASWKPFMKSNASASSTSSTSVSETVRGPCCRRPDRIRRFRARRFR